MQSFGQCGASSSNGNAVDINHNNDSISFAVPGCNGNGCSGSLSNELAEDENMHQVRLLPSAICTNKDYGIGGGILLPDASKVGPEMMKAVGLQALTI